MAQDIISRILYEYDELRSRAESRRIETIKKTYKEYPEIEDIDKTVKKLGLENMRNIMQNPAEGDKINAEFVKKMNELSLKRKALISQLGVNPDFDKPDYKCKLCSDTGYINNQKCECFLEKLKTAEYKTSNLQELVKEQNFDTFNINFYSDKKDGDGESPRTRMEKILKVAKRFCDDFDNENKSLLFYGNPGLGKTFLSSCISKELIDSGKTVLYIRATKLFNIYDDLKFGNCTDREEYENIINKVYNCDLLIIDDLGTEFITKNTYSFMFDFFNDRIMNGKKMIINTNMSLGEIAETYGERIVSRIYEHFLILGFRGNDIRINKIN